VRMPLHALDLARSRFLCLSGSLAHCYLASRLQYNSLAAECSALLTA